jgi:hypothetical protein
MVVTLEELAYAAQILGVVLVIASLAYVGKQLRQNTDALRAQSRYAVLTAAQNEQMISIENPTVTGSTANCGRPVSFASQSGASRNSSETDLRLG